LKLTLSPVKSRGVEIHKKEKPLAVTAVKHKKLQHNAMDDIQDIKSISYRNDIHIFLEDLHVQPDDFGFSRLAIYSSSILLQYQEFHFYFSMNS